MSSGRDASARVGLFGIGLAAYWPQFPSLKERLEGYSREVEARLRAFGAEVVGAGLVDTPERARETGQFFAREGAHLIVGHAPVLVLNLQPSAALDYENSGTAEWLANCTLCSVPEISNAFARALRDSRVGFLGHTCPGMLDMYSDFTMTRAQLAAHIAVLEMCGLAKRVAAGLDRLVEDFALDGLTYYYRGLDGNEYERLGAGLILGNSLLTARGLGVYHGKRGHGVSVEFKVKTGPVTILGLTQTADGRLKMIGAEGESLPGPILRIGNTNSRLRFGLFSAEFANRWCAEGPTHHCSLGLGHNLGKIEKLAALMNVPLAKVGGEGRVS